MRCGSSETVAVLERPHSTARPASNPRESPAARAMTVQGPQTATHDAQLRSPPTIKAEPYGADGRILARAVRAGCGG